MPVDFKGTVPGLTSEKPERIKYNFRCRRPGCDSMEAYDESPPNTTCKRFVCVKCGNVYTVSVGGSFDI
jgi:hypothetical protein